MTRYALTTAEVDGLGLGPVRAAWPVTAETHKAAQRTANWLVGRGTPLVVDGGHMFVGGTGTLTRTLNYRCRVDDAHSSIGVMITGQISSTDGDASWPVEIGGESVTLNNTPTLIHFPIENTVGDGELAIAIEVQWEAKTSLTIVLSCVHVYECPSFILDTTGVENLEPRSLIYDGFDNRESIAGVERVAEELRASYFRRGALFNWATGLNAGANTTSTSYVALHEDGILPAIQNRIMYTGETSRAARVSVYGRVNGGTGNVRITMSSGDSRTLNITSGSNAWVTSSPIFIETDDPSTWDSNRGIRGGSRDEITIEYRATIGFNVRLLGVSIWDAPGD